MGQRRGYNFITVAIASAQHADDCTASVLEIQNTENRARRVVDSDNVSFNTGRETGSLIRKADKTKNITQLLINGNVTRQTSATPRCRRGETTANRHFVDTMNLLRIPHSSIVHVIKYKREPSRQIRETSI
jgi:hypothetical protein